MTRLLYPAVLLFAVIGSAVPGAAPTAAAADKPNIVVIMGDDIGILQARDEALVGQVTGRARDAQVEAHLLGRFDPALRQIEAVAHERDPDLAQIIEMFAQGLQVGEQLAGME